MNAFKRYFGLLFLLIAPFVIYELIIGAIANIDTAGKKDINNPVIWIIIITIFTPIAIGMMMVAIAGTMVSRSRTSTIRRHVGVGECCCSRR